MPGATRDVAMETDEVVIVQEEAQDHDEVAFDEGGASGAVMNPVVETENLPTSGILETSIVENI